MPDIVRIVRIVEYVGPRDMVERQISESLHGTREFIRNKGGDKIRISALTLGDFAEILAKEEEKKDA